MTSTPVHTDESRAGDIRAALDLLQRRIAEGRTAGLSVELRLSGILCDDQIFSLHITRTL